MSRRLADLLSSGASLLGLHIDGPLLAVASCDCHSVWVHRSVWCLSMCFGLFL